MTLVDNVEAEIPPMEIIKNNHLKDIIKFYEGINVEALILGTGDLALAEGAELPKLSKLDFRLRSPDIQTGCKPQN